MAQESEDLECLLHLLRRKTSPTTTTVAHVAVNTTESQDPAGQHATLTAWLAEAAASFATNGPRISSFTCPSWFL